ncbi:hypothetical protein [Paraburkholderia tropica]|uniref:hypothetical protein n=1 Tax=Paraburkholderia tropica TaxID=92647 RepID=UPI002AAFFDAB|nr:hypothetical protein [Paraburkholderia tropica]
MAPFVRFLLLSAPGSLLEERSENIYLAGCRAPRHSDRGRGMDYGGALPSPDLEAICADFLDVCEHHQA